MAPSPPPASLRLPETSDCELSDLSSATGMAVTSASIVRASSLRRPETAGNEVCTDGSMLIHAGCRVVTIAAGACRTRLLARMKARRTSLAAAGAHVVGRRQDQNASTASAAHAHSQRPGSSTCSPWSNSLVAFHEVPIAAELACARSCCARSSQPALANRNRHSGQLCEQPAPPDLGVARHRPRCSLLWDHRQRAAWRTLVDLALPARLLRAPTYPPSSGEALSAITGAHPPLTGALAWQGDAS